MFRYSCPSLGGAYASDNITTTSQNIGGEFENEVVFKQFLELTSLLFSLLTFLNPQVVIAVSIIPPFSPVSSNILVFYVQSWPKKCVLGCAISPLRQHMSDPPLFLFRDPITILVNKRRL